MDYVKRKYDEAESDQARDRFQSYMREVACPACGGARLNPTSLSVLVGGKSIAEVSQMPMEDSIMFIRQLELSERDAKIADQVLIEINARLKFLLDVGLDYLNLERPAGTKVGRASCRESMYV